MKNLAALLYVLLVSSNPLPLHTLSLPSGEKGRVLFPNYWYNQVYLLQMSGNLDLVYQQVSLFSIIIDKGFWNQLSPIM